LLFSRPTPYTADDKPPALFFSIVVIFIVPVILGIYIFEATRREKIALPDKSKTDNMEGFMCENLRFRVCPAR
jgi:hypothetical protein